MPVTVVRYTTTPEGAEENASLVAEVYRELEAARPEGLRYATFQLEDGVTFVHVAAVDTADGGNPLPSLPAFGAFQRDLADRCVQQPIVSSAVVVGTYGLPPGPAGERS